MPHPSIHTAASLAFLALDRPRRASPLKHLPCYRRYRSEHPPGEAVFGAAADGKRPRRQLPAAAYVDDSLPDARPSSRSPPSLRPRCSRGGGVSLDGDGSPLLGGASPSLRPAGRATPGAGLWADQEGGSEDSADDIPLVRLAQARWRTATPAPRPADETPAAVDAPGSAGAPTATGDEAAPGGALGGQLGKAAVDVKVAPAPDPNIVPDRRGPAPTLLLPQAAPERPAPSHAAPPPLCSQEGMGDGW